MANETFKQGDYVTVDGKVYIFNKYISSKLCRVYFTPAMKRKGERVGDDFLNDLYDVKNLRFSSVADLIHNGIIISPCVGDSVKFINTGHWPDGAVLGMGIQPDIWLNKKHTIVKIGSNCNSPLIYIKDIKGNTISVDSENIRLIMQNKNVVTEKVNDSVMYDFSLLLKK